MNVFVDTNVLLDVISRREPFYGHGQEVWALAERGLVRGFVAALSMPNIFYLLRRDGGRKKAMQALVGIRDTFTTVALDEQILNQAIDSGWEDFEDAIQYFSAVRANAECIITRNEDHFAKADMPVYSPIDFLAEHSFE